MQTNTTDDKKITGSSSNIPGDRISDDTKGKDPVLTKILSHEAPARSFKKPEPFTKDGRRIYQCGRPRCTSSGSMESGDICSYSVGPEKDPRSMRFCGVRCWKMFKWSMMDFYSKYPYAFPPKSYPLCIKNAGAAWVRLGYMDDALFIHKREEIVKAKIKAQQMEARLKRQAQDEREGNYEEVEEDNNAFFYTNN
jgi:hypothetical protein